MIRAKREPEESRDNGFTAFRDLVAPVYAGVPVTEENAVNLPAVYTCWRLNSETVASLPVDVYAKRGEQRVPHSRPMWLDSPNDEQDWGQFIEQAQLSLEADGNSFMLKASDSGGRLVGLYNLAPTAVQVERLHQTSGPIVYRVGLATGQQEVFPASAIVHMRGLTPAGSLRGLSPIACAKQAIGVGLAAERFGAQFFGSGANLSGVIESTGTLTKDQAELLQEQFTKKHGGVSKSHAIGVLSNATWKPMSVKPDEAQFLETRRFTDVQLALMYGLPPEYVTEAEGAKGYVSGIYARQYMWLQTGINPRLLRIERALSALLPRPAYIKFNRNAFLAMDVDQRVAYYAAAQLGEWMTRNEIRALEDMNPIAGGDKPLHSVQWQENVPKPPPKPAPDMPADTEPASAGSPVKEVPDA
jgi:HK97 family phage portal protein